MDDGVELLSVAACLVLKNLAWYSISRRRKREVGQVKQIVIYPIKSCCGIQLNKADVAESGFCYNGVRDRSYVVISTTDRRFLSLKIHTRLTEIQPVIDPDRHGMIRLTAAGHPSVPVVHTDTTTVVQYKSETVDGIDCGDAVANWLNSVMGMENLRLVYCPSNPRSVRKKMQQLDQQGMMYKVFPNVSEAPDNVVAFADKAPILLLSDKSLEVLNKKLVGDHSGVDWRNFRPNLVVSGVEADRDEDRWGYIYGANCVLVAAFPCERCTMVNIDHMQDTAIMPDGNPVLQALKRYRSEPQFRNPLFGVDCAVEKPGSLAVGDLLYADIRGGGEF